MRWIWITLGAFLADRWTKLIIERMTPLNYQRTVIPNFFSLVHATNPGLAFGFLADANSAKLTALISICTLIVCLLLAWLLVSGRAGGPLARIGVALILGGAAGNLYDRVLYTRVTDFLYFHIGCYQWPAFNVADTVIAVGAALVALELVFFQRHAASVEER
jgi:signal peptidase II